jgi:hypothetical protein
VFWLAVKGDGFGAAFSRAFSGELEAVGVVDEAIENGVGDRGVPNGSMPGIHGELTCDDGGCAAVAVLEDFEQIAAFCGGEHRTHTGKAAGLSQARERWRVYDVAREVQAAC